MLRHIASLNILLLASSVSAATPHCITTSFSGADPTLEDLVATQLKNELKMPVYNASGPTSCPRLVIALFEKTATLSLLDQETFTTEIDLDKLLPALWPRVIALSAAGLWILAQDQTGTNQSVRKDEDREITPAPRKNISTEKTTPQKAAPQNQKAMRRDAENRIRTGAANIRIQFHLLVSARLVPKFPAGFFDGALGFSGTFPAVHFDLSVVGLWGRTTLDTGRIYSTGFGVRGTLFWRALTRQTTTLGIGPAVEALGVFGRGRGNTGIDSHQAFYPVINLQLLLGSWFALTPTATAHVALGGGWSVLYFNMRMDGKTVSGFSGGAVNVIFGVSFGASSETAAQPQ